MQKKISTVYQNEAEGKKTVDKNRKPRYRNSRYRAIRKKNELKKTTRPLLKRTFLFISYYYTCIH